jgi:hypothetical protein
MLFGANPSRVAADSDAANAAVKYLRADAALRQSYPLPPDAVSKLEKAVETPLDDQDEKLVAAAQDALAEFHHATALKTCDWTMSVEDGPLANTAHRGAIREMAAVAELRARLRFREGDSPGAISDILAAMAAARHLSMDGSLASVLFAYRVETQITQLASQNLHLLSPADLSEFAKGLAALPAGSNLGIALEAEKVVRNDFFLSIAQQAKGREELIDGLAKGVPVLEDNRAVAQEIVDRCGGSIEGFTDCINTQKSFYVSVVSEFALPPAQFEKAYRKQFDDASKTNPLVARFTPNLPAFRWADAYCQTRRALLRAAIGVRLEGVSALNETVDPYDGKPFSYGAFDGGFRLKSELNDRGNPLSLSIPSGS